MIHTAIVLPRDLLDQIKEEAEASGQGLSTLIRQHLQLAYLMPGAVEDPETTNLLGAIRSLANTLSRDLGAKWHQHPYALSAFKAGVMEFLLRYQPEGDGAVRPGTPMSVDFHDPADVVGRTHARLIGMSGHETEESYDPTNYFDETGNHARPKRKPGSNSKKSKD